MPQPQRKESPDNIIALPVRARPEPTLAPRNMRPLGQILLEDGAVDSANLLKASVMRQRQDVRLGEILLAHGWVDEHALARALARQWRCSMVGRDDAPPNPRLIDALGADFCLAHGVVPWRQVGGVTWVATARPELFHDLLPRMPKGFGVVRMLLASETQVQTAVLTPRKTALIRQAESRVPAIESCRTASAGRTARVAVAAIAALVIGLIAAPVTVMSLLCALAITTLVAASILKFMAFRAALRASAEAVAEPPEMRGKLPVISVMVPLLRENDVAGKLVERLSRLRYPRELTDLLLVVEADDDITHRALAGASLPRWIRVITVPEGPIKTKPRALNYALNFCRGSIVGVWDAEDRPDPDQLHKVARRFHHAPDDVACLQGALDFYNPRSNWLARCFTVEYAAWFRALLPGVARLGLVVPLGGTTLFFRRSVLEQLGAWDAWNVTEDADLGVRLARRGYRTEIIDTTTDEEANCRALPWVKQRSRWLKGYAMTWGVHMRDPVALWRDLGPRRFIAFQVQFFGTLVQYLMAPVLWSFWLLSLGLWHPLAQPLSGVWGGYAVAVLFTIFVLSEALATGIGMWAVRGAKHRHLMAWVPTLHFYHPLGCLAGWKALYEVVTKPFYWDKTAHGVFDVTLPGDAVVAGGPAAGLAGTVAVPVRGQIGGQSLSDVAAGRGATAPRPTPEADVITLTGPAADSKVG